MRLAPALALALAVAAPLGAGCGRIGIDLLELAVDAPPEVPAPACPSGTTELAPGAATCVELVEQGSASWTSADQQCRLLGRRLCTDAEWALACVKAQGLIDMFDDQGGAEPNWEWTADMDAGVAQKRGYGACEDMSSHTVDVTYDFRCCAPKS